MNSPLAGAGVTLPRSKRLFEVQILTNLPVLLLGGLGQVDGVCELLEYVDIGLRDLGYPNSGRFLQLEDGDAGVDELIQRRFNVLALDGLVANVINDAHISTQRTDRLRHRHTTDLGQ